MKTMDTVDKDSLRERIEKVLSEILSDKHDCEITLRFVQRDQQRSESECTNA